MVLEWFWYRFGVVWFRYGYCMVLVWIGYGCGMVLVQVLVWLWCGFHVIWFGHGCGMVVAGFDMVLVWFWFGCDDCTVAVWCCMVVVWFWYGCGMVLDWFRYGIGMVVVWYTLKTTGARHGCRQIVYILAVKATAKAPVNALRYIIGFVSTVIDPFYRYRLERAKPYVEEPVEREHVLIVCTNIP
jgi:hypothetical protein